MENRRSTILALLGLVTVIGVAHAWSSARQPTTDARDGEWRVTPLNNGGYVIHGPLPELQVSLPEPAPDAMYEFEAIDGRGNPIGTVAIPVSRILSIGAEDWPVYDTGRDNVVAIRYGTSIRYGDGRWGWTADEYHVVAAELLALGWAVGTPPERWAHPLEGSLPVPAGEWR